MSAVTRWLEEEDDNDHEDAEMPAYAIALLGMAVVLFCFLCARPSIPDASHRRDLARRGREAAAARAEALEEAKRDPQQRAREMAAALITKKVIARDGDFNLTLGEVSDHVELPEEDDHDSIVPDYDDHHEDDAAACVICLDVFCVGDHVTWSKHNQQCLHVFHEDCIVPWLENPKHNGCPSCRCRIITPENEEGDGILVEEGTDEEENVTMAIINGLIQRVRQASQRYSLVLSEQHHEHDLSHVQLGEDSENPPPPMALRRVFSDSHPQQQRRRRSDTLLSVAYKRASGIFSAQQSQEEEGEDAVEYAPNSVPLPPLRIRRVKSLATGSDYVIDRNDDDNSNNDVDDTTPPPFALLARVPSFKRSVSLKRVPSLKRSISLKRVRSVDVVNSDLPSSRSEDSVEFVRRARRYSEGGVRISDTASPPLPLQRASSAQGTTLKRRASFGTTAVPSSPCIPLQRSPSLTSRPPLPSKPVVARGGSPTVALGRARSYSGNQKSYRHLLHEEDAPESGRGGAEELTRSVSFERVSTESTGHDMRRVSSTGSQRIRAPNTGGILSGITKKRAPAAAYSHLQQSDEGTDEEPDIEQGL